MNPSRLLVLASCLLTTNLLGCALDVEDASEFDDELYTPRGPVEVGGEGGEGGADGGKGDGGEGEDGSLEVPPGTCSSAVHIARRDGAGDCPTLPPAWVGEPLFDAGTPWLVDDDEPVPIGLADYCVYRWGLPGFPALGQVEALYESEMLDAVSPSCLAITGQADRLTEELGPLLRDAFHANTGRPSATDVGLPGTGTLDPRVTVMVIDTQSDNDGVPPTSRHGRHMGNIILDIACPDDDPSCRVAVDYVVGLPRVGGGGVNYVNGGIVARHHDLAAAIYEAVRRWEVANENYAVPTNLVLNLSVGWESEIFGGDEADPPPSIEAVRTALEHASCKGAIAIASAGNEGDFCGVVGAMHPAKWETLPAPDATRCADFGLTLDAPLPGYRPLVHAVGGLDVRGGLMPRAREKANPRLMAASAHVAAGDPLYGGLTGTSVGTAATAGAAALVWSYRPDLEPHRVMQWVFAGGTPLTNGLQTDFGLDPTDLPVPRRVDACAALDAACSIVGANCPDMPLTCLDTELPTAEEVIDHLAGMEIDVTMGPGPTHIDSSCTDECGDPVDIHVGPGASADCEVFDVDPAEHLVNPTPDSIACPTCGIQDNVVSMSLSPDFRFEQIDTVLIEVMDDQEVIRLFDLGPLELSPYTLTVVTLPEGDMPPGIVREAHVTIDYDDRRTTTDSLLVL